MIINKRKTLIFIFFTIILLLSIFLLYLMNGMETFYASFLNMHSSDNSTLLSDKNGNGIKIESPFMSETYAEYMFKNGEPFKLYEICVKVKNENINSNPEIKVHDESDWNGKYVKSRLNIEKNETIILKRIVKLDEKGSIRFRVYTEREGAMIKGNIFIYIPELRAVDYLNEYKILTSDDKKIRMVFFSDDIIESGKSSSLLQEWVNIYSKLRKSMKYLIGCIEPYEGTTDYIFTEQLGYYALAGNPIYVNNENAVSLLKEIEILGKKDNLVWGLIHEMGHTFDGTASKNLDLRWVFDPEFFATFKSIYCLNVNGYDMESGTVKKMQLNTVPLSSEIYSNEGFIYRLLEIIEFNWSAVCETFWEYHKLPNDKIFTDTNLIYRQFIGILSEKSKVSIMDMFTEKERKTLERHFTPTRF